MSHRSAVIVRIHYTGNAQQCTNAPALLSRAGQGRAGDSAGRVGNPTDSVALQASIVEQLQRRFEQGQIYTYIGDILLAVNPFASLGLYGELEQARYRGRARSDNPPHIFAVADSAYQALVHQSHNQAIVISGESGAGKTESANLLLKQLVYLGKVLYGTL